MPFIPGCVALVLWALSLRNVPLDRMSDLGLLSVLPLLFYIPLVILTISFCFCVRRRVTPERLLLFHIVALIAIIHGTPTLLYGTLRYSWAWKHIGLVDYIQRHGSLDPVSAGAPGVYFLTAYHNWPGFFALSALYTQVAGLDSALLFASWAPAFFNLLFLGPLLLILRALSLDQRVVWLSLWFFYVTSWVGQDYFSPQAMAYFFHMTIIGICLHWLAQPIPRWQERFRLQLVRLHLTHAPRPPRLPILTTPAQRVGVLFCAILIDAAMASSHQLTPILTILVVGALVVFQRCRARLLPVMLGVLTSAWLIYGAAAFISGNRGTLIGTFFQPSGNIASNLLNLAQVSPGQALVANVGRALTLGMWGLGLAGMAWRLRRGHWEVAGMLLGLTPFALLGGNSYGGEILFRVYFFALPFMAFFAATIFYPEEKIGALRWQTIVLIILSGLLLLGLNFAYYGKEQVNYFSPSEIAAAEFLINTAPVGSLIVEGSYNYPSLFHDYEYYSYWTLSSGTRAEQTDLLADPVTAIAQAADNNRDGPTFVIFTRRQLALVDQTGLLRPPGSFNRVVSTIGQSPRFTVVYSNADAIVLRFNSGTVNP